MAVNLRLLSNRLVEAREVLAYSREEVSRSTGIEVPRLEAIEQGGARPAGDEVLVLASFYDCDFRGFLDESLPAPVQQAEILFRRYGDSFTPVDRRAIQEFLYLCEVESQLEQALSVSKISFAFAPTGRFFKSHGQDAAQALRKLLSYNDLEVPRDIYRDFREIGVHIFRRRLENSEISGLYVEHPQAGHCVLINYNEDIYRQRFSVGHEVAHSIFDSGDNVKVSFYANSSKFDKNDLQEIRASSFASCYLMPPSMLGKVSSWDAESGKHWAQQFRVSTAALAKALKDAGQITEPTAAIIRSVRVASDEKIDPEAPDTLTQLQQERRLRLLDNGLSTYYVKLAFEAHYQSIISSGRLAEALRVDVSELAEIAVMFGRTI